MTNIITILGATACGKTTLAVALADAIGGEIISADSRQIYCGMDIGTGKDLNEYIISDKIINDNYVQLLEVCGNNLSLLMINCNGFCAGYVLACKTYNIDISNMLDEFGTCC